MLKKITLFFLWVSASTYGQCYSGFNIGEYHVVSIKSDGTLWGWGSSDAGSLGNTNSINPSSFQIGTSTDWLKVSAGAYNTFVIKNNGGGFPLTGKPNPFKNDQYILCGNNAGVSYRG